MRRLTLKCMKTNILFRATHLPGKKNTAADLLSRLQIQRFRELVAQPKYLLCLHSRIT